MVSPAKGGSSCPENKVRTDKRAGRDIDHSVIEKIGGRRTIFEAGAPKDASIVVTQREYRKQEETQQKGARERPERKPSSFLHVSDVGLALFTASVSIANHLSFPVRPKPAACAGV